MESIISKMGTENIVSKINNLEPNISPRLRPVRAALSVTQTILNANLQFNL